MQKIEKSFQKGLKSLEQINILGGQDISPLVGAANHHFSELRRKALEGIDKNKDFEKLNGFLANHLEAVFQNYIKESKSISQAQIHFNDYSWGNREWNYVINIIPEMLKVLDLLNVSTNIQLAQEKEAFVLRSWISHDYSVENSRAEIYSIFRTLLKNKILMTYSLKPNVRKDESIIELRFDLSHNDDQVYCIESSKNSSLEFSNVFSNYELLKTEEYPHYKHNILEIDKNFNLKKNETNISELIDLENDEDNKKQVIHFSFLFQPLTLILPQKGKLNYRDENRENFIDIFEMISSSK